jgi:hypothetical protein
MANVALDFSPEVPLQLPGPFAFGAAVFAFDGGRRRGGGDSLAFVFVAGELHAASEFHAARAPLFLLMGRFLPVRFLVWPSSASI